jgi:meso-butanediol dehydrogenase / (S,S)-butanediol dehydrogenase / diacetyl reductase
MTEPKPFAGHGVLITGAARGIGAAVARRLAEEGARVLVTDHDLPAAERAADGLREQGLAAGAFACDVADRASVEAAVASPAPSPSSARSTSS